MFLLRLFFLALGLAGLLYATTDGLTDLVTWDGYSLTVDGRRTFIFSGEFHYARMPVPEMWLDIFMKFKANGLNAVSLYFFWSVHSSRPGEFDFETSGKNVQQLLDYAKQAGLYVIARPGPYINAETNAGGFALWTSDGSGGKYRTNDETYYQAWLPWMTEIGGILARNQITEGGPVIAVQSENELSEPYHQADNDIVLYMEQVEKVLRDAGIVVPFTSNEKGQRSRSWSTDYENVGGAVNLYGLDSYPGGFTCGSSGVNSGFNVIRNYYQWFQNNSFTQPEFLPEFEGGYFTPWGGSFYDDCVAEHDPAFADVFYKNNLGQRVSMMNLYMAWGGTNWGNLAAPVVYTSYDYSAPLRETREIQDKFYQTKLIALFTRVSHDLLYTDMESNGTGNAVSTSDIWTWVLRNPATSAGFYVTQQDDSTSRAVTDFSIYLETSVGNVTVPNVQLNGHQSKTIVTDYNFYDFQNRKLLYSTADVLTFGIFDWHTVLVLYLEEGQTGEFAFAGEVSNLNVRSTNTTSSFAQADLTPSFIENNGNGYTKFVYSQSSGYSVVELSNGILVYLCDQPSAWTFWAAPTVSDPNVQPYEQLFALGPYLVRGMAIRGDTVLVTGDNANATYIEVYVGDRTVSTITWNGVELPTGWTSYGSMTASLEGVAGRDITLPTLTNWRTADSLPEKARNYDDSSWTVCDKTTTLSPVQPLSLPVLFASDYGYYAGPKIYRGYFDDNSAISVNLTAQNGLASGWSAWLNGKLVGYDEGNAKQTGSSALLDFSTATLYDTDNVLTVLVDYTGHDETSTGPSGAENPRGLLGAVLYGPSGETQNFTTWKIAGNAGGPTNIDPVRGPLNEGGLHGERLGWHLPGFAALGSEWSWGGPAQGLAASGVAWYISTFTLALDADLDVPLGVELGAPAGTVASAMLYVNGYQYGKFIPQIGPQTRFPIPPGVVNNAGENTLAIGLWAQSDAGASLDTVELFAYGAYESSFGFSRDWSSLQPGWSRSRLQYA
ncbi:hypothetical protein MBLNU459_g5906t1 [Dothideomycetes sp. NU459]